MDSGRAMDPANMLAAILIASFAIDRIVTGLLFLLSFRKDFPDASKVTDASAARRYKLIYFSLAFVLSVLVIVFWGQLAILASLGLPDPLRDATRNPRISLDTILTVIILVGGADRIAGLLESKLGATETRTVEPIEIKGKITLESKDSANT